MVNCTKYILVSLCNDITTGLCFCTHKHWVSALLSRESSPSDSYSIRHTVSYPDPTDVSIITCGIILRTVSLGKWSNISLIDVPHVA